jgi:hypothetical protein
MGMFDGETRADGDYISWTKAPIGTVVKLKITSPPKMTGGKIDWLAKQNKFNPAKTDQLAFIGGTTPEGEDKILTLVRGSMMFDAIAIACGSRDLEVGDELAVALTGEKDVGKGNPLKVFKAQHTPAKVSTSAAELDPFA